jgi:hypothetical protein
MSEKVASVDWVDRAAHLEARHGESRQQELRALQAILDALGVYELLEGIGQQVWRDGAVRFAPHDYGQVGECGYELACAYEDAVTFVDAADDDCRAPGDSPACQADYRAYQAGACESVLAVTITWREDGLGRIVGRGIRVCDAIGRPIGDDRRGAMGGRALGARPGENRAWPPIPLAEREAEIRRLLETYLAESCAFRLTNDLSIPDLRWRGRAHLDALLATRGSGRGGRQGDHGARP